MLGPMTSEPSGTLLPVGRGTVEAEPLTNSAGDHALLLRQAGEPRLLVLAEPGDVAESGRERVVVMPFDGDVETRVDGDALATWIAQPFDAPSDDASARVPAWASALGFVLVILVVALTVIGGAVVFAWILDVAA
jgi:hypothetical protein